MSLQTKKEATKMLEEWLSQYDVLLWDVKWRDTGVQFDCLAVKTGVNLNDEHRAIIRYRL